MIRFIGESNRSLCRKFPPVIRILCARASFSILPCLFPALKEHTCFSTRSCYSCRSNAHYCCTNPPPCRVRRIPCPSLLQPWHPAENQPPRTAIIHISSHLQCQWFVPLCLIHHQPVPLPRTHHPFPSLHGLRHGTGCLSYHPQPPAQQGTVFFYLPGRHRRCRPREPLLCSWVLCRQTGLHHPMPHEQDLTFLPVPLPMPSPTPSCPLLPPQSADPERARPDTPRRTPHLSPTLSSAQTASTADQAPLLPLAPHPVLPRPPLLLLPPPPPIRSFVLLIAIPPQTPLSYDACLTIREEHSNLSLFSPSRYPSTHLHSFCGYLSLACPRFCMSHPKAVSVMER